MLAPDPLRPLQTFGFLALQYQKLSTKINELLASESETFDRKIKKLKRRTMKEDIESWALKTLYPDTIRYAMFVAIYSQFEFYLNETCKELERKHKIKLSDLKDRGITRANTYLKKVVGFEAPFDRQSWQKVTDLNIVRNWIVHADGTIGPHDDIKVINRINNWAPVEVRDSKIILSKPFNKNVSQLLHSSAKELFEQLKSAGRK